MNIIIVDDETAILDILKRSIHWDELGIHEVFTARNASEAKSVLTRQPVDIAVCDIEMPRESGLSLISWINDFYPEMVNIILTGHQDFNYARDAISLGVFAYLLKPVLFAELEKTIGAAVSQIRADRENFPERMAADDPYDFNRQQPLKGFPEEIREYIAKHYGEEITRAKIEALVHLNIDHVNREFKKATGFSLMEYIQHYRIFQAKEMLAHTQLSISEIASRCGYNSQSYFSEIFRKCTGMAPNEFRKNNAV
ncbi:MAG: response regulator [Lachnospiraceae bacterium]|nr:response regulator [Lachnospiraceae bacterium]